MNTRTKENSRFRILKVAKTAILYFSIGRHTRTHDLQNMPTYGIIKKIHVGGVPL